MRYIDIKGGVKLPLYFDLFALAEAEESAGTLNTWDDQLASSKRVDTLSNLIAALGNSGLRAENLDPVLAPEWVKKHLLVHKIYEYQNTVITAIMDGNRTEEVEQNTERDLVLERIKKVRVNEDLPSAASSTTL